MSLDDELAALLANGCGPALTATVLDRGTVRYAGTAGRPDIADPTPTAFAPGHRFRIGSLTKTYIATLVTLLFADGDLAPRRQAAARLRRPRRPDSRAPAAAAIGSDRLP
ncbi:MAG TPA: serine hydrolase, partial [Micromonosporaceae bacterium]